MFVCTYQTKKRMQKNLEHSFLPSVFQLYLIINSHNATRM